MIRLLTISQSAVVRQQQRYRVEHMDGRAHVGGGIGAVQRPHRADAVLYKH